MLKLHDESHSEIIKKQPIAGFKGWSPEKGKRREGEE